MEPKHMKLPLGGPAWLRAMAEDKEEMADALPAETERRKIEDGREILGLRDAANRMAELEVAVADAAAVFTRYAEAHAAKNTQEGAEKASVNRYMAAKMRHALKT